MTVIIVSDLINNHFSDQSRPEWDQRGAGGEQFDRKTEVTEVSNIMGELLLICMY